MEDDQHAIPFRVFWTIQWTCHLYHTSPEETDSSFLVFPFHIVWKNNETYIIQFQFLVY